jgi:antitoxin (DNA-binding transcriptional repressor) of toxin-antitoxin stability system
MSERPLPKAARGAQVAEPFEITKHGRPVGKLGPPDAVRDPRVVAEAVARLKSYRGAVKSLQTADVLALKHEGHRY